MKEWSSPYNSFNSYKGLLYRANFDGILSGQFLPPVEVNVDPCNNCNLFCVWCNGKNIISRKEPVLMARDHLLDLVKFCKDWGVKAICFAGGGEPTMNPALSEAYIVANELGLETAIITNGLFADGEQLGTVAKVSRWIGISMDAATNETYFKTKGVDCFDKVKENIVSLSKYTPREVTGKFLIHPMNQYEIYDACRLAKDLGMTCFHSRILSGKYIHDSGDFNYTEINSQIERCRGLEDDKFKVFTITHKHEGNGNRRINFTKCKASPLLCMFEADGRVSVCIDRKGFPETTLCSHENPETVRQMWGSEAHKKLLDRICPEKDCPKCTMTIYQELLNAYEKDSFCRNFP